MTAFAPVILLAFANDADDHLAMLTRERKSIGTALQRYEDQRYIRVQVEPNAGINDIFGLFNRFAGQIAIFHYAGHASGTALNLETASGENEAAHAGGLAKLMGLSETLQLVFLNGCATKDQVQALLANGVKAVIATSVPINDAMATEFAEQFYAALASGKTVQEAFASASALIATRYGDGKKIGEFRGMSWGDQAEAVSAELSWGLYLQPEGDTVATWKLPEQTETDLVIAGSPGTASHAANLTGNDGLIQDLFEAIAPHSPELGAMLEVARRTNRQDLRTVRQLIIDAFPSPLGEQLRKLFASSAVDEPRLRQLVATYETLIKLFAFTSLSQLWDTLHDNPGLTVSEADWGPVEAFKHLDAAREPLFDYLGLIVAVDRILASNRVQPFMHESEALQRELTDTETGAAHLFMDGMRARLPAGPFPPAEIGPACTEGAQHLGTLLTDLAFLFRYKMATIKGIAINKSRHKQAEFLHRQVLLDRITAGFVDSDEARTSYTDNESVIMLKDLADVSQYLNLTPFVIDENALLGYEGTKIYFYSHWDEAQDAYHFYSIADPTDRRVVTDQLEERLAKGYAPIKACLDAFRAEMARP